MSDTDDDVNEGEENAEGLEDGGGSKLNAKKILLFIVLPLLLLGGGAGAYFSGALNGLLGKSAEEGTESAGAHGDGHGGGHGAPGIVFYEIPDLIVNLNSTTGQPRYLKLRVQLQLKSEQDKLAIERIAPRVIDQFQTYLRELRIRDLRGSAGIYRLRLELLARVNAAAYPVEVKDVLFQEILIQ